AMHHSRGFACGREPGPGSPSVDAGRWANRVQYEALSPPARTADGSQRRRLSLVAGSRGLPGDVDRMVPELPAPGARRAVRHLAAAALACLGALRRGVRAPPVLTLPEAWLAQGDTGWDRSGGRHHECLPG